MSAYFSVVIPTYNRAAFVMLAVESLLKQEDGDFEVIVVDDGGTDDTGVRLARIMDPRVRYVRKENGERAAARNHGAALSGGRYVTYLDSDDFVKPNHLAEARRMVTHHGEPPVFHLGYEIRSPDGALLGGPMVEEGSLNDLLALRGNLLSCNGVFIRRDAALENRFNEDRALSGSEDYELWLRLGARYPVIGGGVVTSVIVNHDARSVLRTDEEKLTRRMELLLLYAFEDPFVAARYGRHRSRMSAEGKSYASLHLALAGRRAASVRYLWQALLDRPALIGDRRFLAICKHLLRP